MRRKAEQRKAMRRRQKVLLLKFILLFPSPEQPGSQVANFQVGAEAAKFVAVAVVVAAVKLVATRASITFSTSTALGSTRRARRGRRSLFKRQKVGSVLCRCHLKTCLSSRKRKSEGEKFCSALFCCGQHLKQITSLTTLVVGIIK